MKLMCLQQLHQQQQEQRISLSSTDISSRHSLHSRHSSMHSLQLQQLKTGKKRRGGKEEETESGVRTSIDIRIDVSGVSAFAFKLSLNWIFYYVNIEVATKVSLLPHLPTFPPLSLSLSLFSSFCWHLPFPSTFCTLFTSICARTPQSML